MWLVLLPPFALAMVLLLVRALSLQRPLLPPLQSAPRQHQHVWGQEEAMGSQGEAATAANAPARTEGALLVIAHPDDESMFFSPTVLSLTRAGHPVWVLCLSTGAHAHACMCVHALPLFLGRSAWYGCACRRACMCRCIRGQWRTALRVY